MNLELAKQIVLSKYNKGAFLLNKNSPELLLIGGITGMIGSTVLACKATLDIQEPLFKTQAYLIGMEKLHKEDPGYSKESYLQDRSRAVGMFVKDIAQAYGPAAVVGAASIAMLVGSNRILSARNAGLAAAYALVDGAYKQYRSRVIDELGEDVDNYLRYKKPLEDVNLQVLDGKKKVDFASVENADLEGEIFDEEDRRLPSPYARFFDEDCPAWRKSNLDNEFFLKSQQNYANEMLQLRGHMFLNEVYDMLDLPRTDAGAIVGWIYDKEKGIDGYIDFDLYNGYNNNWVNGYPVRQVLLDFNVDGSIWDRF